jgi:large subunit ribosomal protein L5
VPQNERKLAGETFFRRGEQILVEMQAKLQEEYKRRIIPLLLERHKYRNTHQVPRIEKIVINTCVASASDIKEALEVAQADLGLITGQKPIVTLSKKNISNFKLRKHQEIGSKVTLRGRIMYEFLERFISAALPRIRDFRGVSTKAFDGHGNYTIGISDQSIFPEVELDKVKRTVGFDVTIVTTASTNEEAKSLLTEVGMPFSDRGKEPTSAA